MAYNKSAGLFVLCTALFSYATSSAMDVSEMIENRIRYFRNERIKTVNSMQKLTGKRISDKEFLEKLDFKMRLLDDLDGDIKQSEEKLKELSKSKL